VATADDLVVAASAGERRAVADLIDSLDDAQLNTPSLCAGWSVRTVAGQLAAAVTPGTFTFVVELLRQRGRSPAAALPSSRS
jgi:hypothetical protein